MGVVTMDDYVVTLVRQPRDVLIGAVLDHARDKDWWQAWDDCRRWSDDYLVEYILVYDVTVPGVTPPR